MKIVTLPLWSLSLSIMLGIAFQTAMSQTPAEHALNINIGFNGRLDQFPHADDFYKQMDLFYASIPHAVPGNRHCHTYISWDIAEPNVPAGAASTEGTRAWFKSWLDHAEGHCARALITFKHIGGVTVNSPNGYPTVATYQHAMNLFLHTNWSKAWTGAFDYTAWNEPNNPRGSGNGLTVKIPAERAADYYLALRALCKPTSCGLRGGGNVAAGDFGSNGLWKDFVQNCPNDLAAALCANASYMDKYKHWLATDTKKFPSLASTFRPEVFAYHGWDDINNFLHGNQCTDQQRCTIRAFTRALSGNSWTGSVFWDTEVGAGQDGKTNPGPVKQACAASFLMKLTASVSPRFARIYYTRAFNSDGEHGSLFNASGAPKPAFEVLVQRNISYKPPAGQSCP